MKNNFILENIQNLIEKGEINYSQGANLFFESQKQSWELLKNGSASLSSVRVKIFNFGDFNIKVQFNPGRIVSTSAKVDNKSIAERKCFLCVENLPEHQKSLIFNERFYILCNPFPIFPEHFTLTNKSHVDQRIEPFINDMLSFSKEMKDYTIFYNGPKCGASAPDHMHFQAGTKYFMPIDSEIELINNKYGKIIYRNNLVSVSAIDDSLRKIIYLKGSDEQELIRLFNIIYKEYSKTNPSEEEPMFNIISFYEKNIYKIIIILREKHRPTQYFAEGEDNILLSPASVDIGGVCITPLEKDFNKITKEDLIDIFNQVSLSKTKFNLLLEGISKIK